LSHDLFGPSLDSGNSLCYRTGPFGRGGIFGRIAQLVEQLTLNQRVPGSSPGAPTIDPAMLFELLHQNIAEQFETRFEKSVASAFSLPPFELGDGAVAESGIAGEIVRVED
jgi:hypothetical protein